MKTIYIILLLSTSSQLYSQNIDSLKNVISTYQNIDDRFSACSNLMWMYRNTQLDSAFHYAKIAHEMIEEVDQNNQANYYYRAGILNRNNGSYAISIENYSKNLTIRKALGFQKDIAKAHYGLSTAYLENLDFESGLEQVLASKAIFEMERDTFGVLRCINLIGIIMKDTERPKEAEGYFMEGIAYAEALKSNGELAHFYGNLASNYTDLKDHVSALSYYKKALKIDEDENNLWGTGMILENMGRTYSKLKNFQEAEKVLTRSLVIKKQLNHKPDIAGVEGKLGYAKGMNGKYEEGVKLLVSSVDKARKNNYSETLLVNNNFLALVHAKNGNFELAYKFTIEEKDSLIKIWEKNLDSKVTEIETKFETQEKALEIIALKNEKEIDALQLKNARLTNFALMAVAILFCGLFLWLRSLYKKIKIQNNEKEILIKEIHHRVKNNLQLISSLLNLQSQHIKDESAIIALKEGQDRVKSMALIHQNLYQEENLTGVELKVYFEKLISNLFHSYNISNENIQLKMDIDNLSLDVDSVIPLGLIVNELVSNSLKYAFPNNKHGVVTVRIKEINTSLFLEVSDNGVGHELTLGQLENSSFGYKLINAFKDQLDAEMKIENEDGYKVSFSISDYKKVA